MALNLEVPEKIARLANSGKRHRAAKGGRGSGKSYSIHGIEAVLSIPRARRVLIVRETQRSLEDSSLAVLKRVIKDWGVDSAFIETRHGLSTVSGSEFLFYGLQNPDRIKSLDDVDVCIVEEAHRIPKDAIDILVPTIRKPGSYFWWLWNPDTDDDPVDVELVQSGRPDVAVEVVNYSDNPWFTETELVAEMEWDRLHDTDKYLHIWEGHTRSFTEAQVFHGKWRVDNFDPPTDDDGKVTIDAYYFGADWGFSQDPTALVRCYIVDNTLYIDHEAYGVNVDLPLRPALFETVPDVRDWMITADSAWPDTISYMAHAGFRIRGAQKGPNSVEDGIAFLRGFDEIVIHERCRHTADEFKLYSYKRDRLTGEILPKLEDKHNHCVDALRYALEMVMHSKRAPQVTATQRIW